MDLLLIGAIAAPSIVAGVLGTKLGQKFIASRKHAAGEIESAEVENLNLDLVYDRRDGRSIAGSDLLVASPPRNREARRQLLAAADAERHEHTINTVAGQLDSARRYLYRISHEKIEDHARDLGLIMDLLNTNNPTACSNNRLDWDLRIGLDDSVKCMLPQECPQNIWQSREKNSKANFGIFDFRARYLFATSSYPNRPVNTAFAKQLEKLLSYVTIFPKGHPALQELDELIAAFGTYLYSVLRPEVGVLRSGSSYSAVQEEHQAYALKKIIEGVTERLRSQSSQLSSTDLRTALFIPPTTPPPVKAETVEDVVPAAPVSAHASLLTELHSLEEDMDVEQVRKFSMWEDQLLAAEEILRMSEKSTSSMKQQMQELAEGNQSLAVLGLQNLLSEIRLQQDIAVVKDLRTQKVFLENEVADTTEYQLGITHVLQEAWTALRGASRERD